MIVELSIPDLSSNHHYLTKDQSITTVTIHLLKNVSICFGKNIPFFNSIFAFASGTEILIKGEVQTDAVGAVMLQQPTAVMEEQRMDGWQVDEWEVRTPKELGRLPWKGACLPKRTSCKSPKFSLAGGLKTIRNNTKRPNGS
jgi:hypothetical protein